MSIPPSRLGDYANRISLDALVLNSIASDGQNRTPRIPAELLYQPFQTFLQQTEQPLYHGSDPRFTAGLDPSTFFPAVFSFLRCVAARYDDEGALTAALTHAFTNVLGTSMTRGLTPRNAGERPGQTDASVEYNPMGFPRRHFILIREDKLGSGSGGGDSLYELVGHYLNVVRFDPQAPTSPTVLVEIVGQRIAVSLAAIDDNRDVCVSQSVVSMSLALGSAPDVLVGRVAALFAALRVLLVKIASDCTNFPQPLLTQDRRCGSNLVFRTDNSYDKYLRYESFYGSEAHTWCSSNGFAPTYTDHRVCPGWRNISMTTDSSWNLALQAPTGHRYQILERVRAVLQQLHAGGFVHGDVRASNVLYKLEGSELNTMQVMLIDFDEAGRIGQAHYGPLPFNAAIPRAPDVAPGGPIACQHDLWQTENDGRFFV
jgi:hypothetical protein